MSSRFSGIGSEWYNDEVGDDEFDLLQTHMAPEDNGEVTIFDINGGIQRVTKSIGAKWYYAKDTMTVDDFAPGSVPCFEHGSHGSLNGQGFTSQKTAPLGLLKPLPSLPMWDEDKVTVQNAAEIAVKDGLRFPVGARTKAVPFDYMFADADENEVTTTHDEDDDSILPGEMTEDEDDVAVEDIGPFTPQVVHHHHAQVHSVNQALGFTGIDTSAVHTHAFHAVGIPATTTDLIDDHILALGTNVAVPPSINGGLVAGKARATDIFFKGPVEESPSPYHKPLLNETTGYGDIREGTEDFPELWRLDEPELKTFACEEADALAPSTFDDVPPPKAKAGLNLSSLAARAQARKAKKAAALNNVDVGQKTPVLIDLTVDDNASDTYSLSKKRRARSSFATKSTFGDENDDDVRYLYTKKVRATSEKDDDEVFNALRPSVFSLITRPDDTEIAGVDASPNSNVLRELSGLKGFNGQFKGMQTTEQAERAKKHNAEKVAVYVGQASHLNNLILHKDMHVCPTFETTEYTEASAPADSDIGRCISYADKQSQQAAAMARSPAEDLLRREAHHECTAARLEGVVVGCYRYFQGHLNVQEYHERNMCICWQLCECSKICTRFADLMCPCADKIETNCR